jgi:hypothetical protein
MATAIQYRRLPGKAFSLMGNATLWLASDHILSVRTGWLSEDYQRFYLREIQATMLRQKQGPGIPLETIAISALVVLLFSALAFPWIAVLALMGGTVYAVHKLRGPECCCFVKTATGTWDLPALCRMRRAERALALLRPAIEAAQGVFDADAVLESGAVPYFPAPRQPERPVGHRWYVALLVSVLVSAALGISGVRFLSVLATLSSGVVVALALIVLIRRRQGEGAERYTALLILAFKTVKGCLSFVQPLWISLIVARSGSIWQYTRMTEAMQDWRVLYTVFEVLLAMTAVAGFVNMSVNRHRAPQTIFSADIPSTP